MNELLCVVRIFERGPDDHVIMIPHDQATAQTPSSTRETLRTVNDRNRRFINWFRRQFPQVATEFRYLHRGWSSRFSRNRKIQINQHFVAYGLSSKDLLLVKMTWMFKSYPIRITQDDQSNDEAGAYYVPESMLRPSDDLKARLELGSPRVKNLATKDI